MAGWYVRRGEKVIGPVDLAKLKESAAAGMLLPTDQLAKDVAGPWTEASRTTLFANKEGEPSRPPPPPQQALTKVGNQPLAPVPEPLPVQDRPTFSDRMIMVVRGTNVFFATIGHGILSAGGAVGRSLSTRAQRRHELKLAKIQAQALADSQRPKVDPALPAAPAVPIIVAPQMTQTTVVKVTQNGCGCSGCGTLVMLILLGILGAIIYFAVTTSR
jgi:hypothetical protein